MFANGIRKIQPKGSLPSANAKKAETKNHEHPPPFIEKLYNMIENCDPTIAGWTDSGDAFVVKIKTAFEENVIPNYFGHNRFTSFERQLNFYCFRKVHTRPTTRACNEDPNVHEHKTYHNPHFQRGKPDLLALIKRANRGGASGIQAADEHRAEVERLKKKVNELQLNLGDMVADFEGRVADMTRLYWAELIQLANLMPNQNTRSRDISSNFEMANAHNAPTTPSDQYASSLYNLGGFGRPQHHPQGNNTGGGAHDGMEQRSVKSWYTKSNQSLPVIRESLGYDSIPVTSASKQAFLSFHSDETPYLLPAAAAPASV